MSNADALAVSTIRLRDGRLLAYLAVGRPNGPAVIHCHGSGSSRLEGLFLAHAADELGLRLIAIDRPGIGCSDPHRYLNVADWANDVAELADQLGLGEFAVEGMSNGGPYALACAVKFPHRLKACGLISSIAPAEIVHKAGPMPMRLMWWIGQRYPGAVRSYIRWRVPDTKLTVAEADKEVSTWIRWMSKADRQALQNKSSKECLARTVAEHRRQGGIGGRYEAEVGMRPWGFTLSEVRLQRLFLWHGEQDRIVNAHQAHAFAAALPHCRARFFRDEGHFSMLLNRAHDILAQLMPAGDGS